VAYKKGIIFALASTAATLFHYWDQGEEPFTSVFKQFQALAAVVLLEDYFQSTVRCPALIL